MNEIFILCLCEIIALKVMNCLNVPTYLTLLRVFMALLMTITFYLPVCWSAMMCTVIFFVAAVTDWLDGFLARRWNQVTNFGKFLDPVADKIVIVTAFILISDYFHVWWITLPISSIVLREIIISALREWVSAAHNQYNSISVSWISKVKTCMQMLALLALLCRLNEWIIIMGVIALYIAVLLTHWSMYCYFYSVRKNFLSCQYKIDD